MGDAAVDQAVGEIAHATRGHVFQFERAFVGPREREAHLFGVVMAFLDVHEDHVLDALEEVERVFRILEIHRAQRREPAEQVLPEGVEERFDGLLGHPGQRDDHVDHFPVVVVALRQIGAAGPRFRFGNDLGDHVGREHVLDHVEEFGEDDTFHVGSARPGSALALIDPRRGN